MAEHNLQLGILGNLREAGGVHRAEPPYLAVVEDGDEVNAVIIQTPPFHASLSLVRWPERQAEIIALAARDLSDARPNLPGALGPADLGEAFAQEWQRLPGQAQRMSIRERIYQLSAVRPVQGVPGHMRHATEADRKRLVRWIAAFEAESHAGQGVPLDAGQWVESALTWGMRTVCLWDDGEPVALACAANPTPHGIRVGPVYTPPEHRRHGYARACVAVLSQLMLDRGRRFCFLCTDLANPTANPIDQEIGYQPVLDVTLDRFEAVTRPTE